MAIEFNKPSAKSSASIGTRKSSGAPSAKKATPEASSTAPKAASGGDQVAISGHAQRIQALEAQIKQIPEVDSARVEEIKNSIAEGRYEVDAESTAQKMLALEQSLHRLSDKE